MPPKQSQSVYAVTRRDYDHHTDKKGSLSLVEVHADVESANTAAKAHLTKELAKSTVAEDDIEEDTNKDGGFEGRAWPRSSKIDNFIVTVKKMPLKGDASKSSSAPAAASKSAAKSAPKRAAPKDDDDEDEDDEDAPAAKKKPAAKKPAAKKPAQPSAKGSIPDGITDALQGLSLLFTGTFDSMDRNTSIATAKAYGGDIVSKLTDADFIIVGTRAGDKKIQEIKEKGLKTIDEAGFLELLKDPVPKRAALGV